MRTSLTAWSVPGLFLAVFLTAYAPVLMSSYAFYDDYQSLAPRQQKALITYKIYEGRPLLALGTRLFLHTTAIEDLRLLRFMGIGGIAMLAWMVFRLLVRAGWSRVQSFCVGVIIGTTFPFQVYAAFATTAFNIFAALASGLAFTLGERAFTEQGRLAQWLLGVGASLALFIGITIHQSAAMFFWVFAAITVLKPDMPPGDMLRRFGWYGMIVIGGMLLGFVVYKLGLSLHPDFHARTGIVQDIPGKVIWFLYEALPNALSFVLLSPAHWFFSDGSPTPSSFHRSVDIAIAWGVFALIVGGLILYAHGTLRERLWKWGIAMSLLPLSYAPNLLVSESRATYRTLSSLTAVLVVYAFFAFRGYAKHRRRPLFPVSMNAVLGSVALTSALSATYHVHTYFVVPQVRELGIMRSQLVQQDIARARGIYVIRAKWGDTLAPLVRHEFGRPSSVGAWAPDAMVYLLLREIAPDSADLPVMVVAADEPIDAPPGSLVVDMGTLLRQAQRDRPSAAPEH